MTVDFFQVKSVHPLPHPHPFCSNFLSHPFLFVLSPGGSVPQVGVTITMDDEFLNGTNRVVLDGVMTEKECDKILQLATVSSDCRRVRPSHVEVVTLSPTISSRP